MFAIGIARNHSPWRWPHPHLVAPLPSTTLQTATAPNFISVRDLDVAEARAGSALPLLADLSVLKVPEPVHRPSTDLSESDDRSRTAADGLKVQSRETLFGSTEDVKAARSPMAGTAAHTAPYKMVIAETRLPPLSLAPLHGTITALEKGFESLNWRDRLCEIETAPLPLTKTLLKPESFDFGRALAAAALRQTEDFVVYTDKYRRMSFPMGDVPAMFGVCTDVIIRAYRALGIDLQALIHAARIGSADRNIAHRRTFTLRRYFASRGASLPVTDFVEDYRPGDVVTYDRPQNRGSRDHIAIVTDVPAPSGRPMIVHNRGWGPQLEDALFVDKITGHYRYRGQTEPQRFQSRGGAKAKSAKLGESLPAASVQKQDPEQKPDPTEAQLRLPGRANHAKARR